MSTHTRNAAQGPGALCLMRGMGICSEGNISDSPGPFPCDGNYVSREKTPTRRVRQAFSSCVARCSIVTGTDKAGSILLSQPNWTGKSELGDLLSSDSKQSRTSRARRPRNAILGWFVVGFLVFAALSALRFGFADYPLVPIECLILITGLVVTRLRRGQFGKGWFTATAIIGFLGFFGAVGLALGPDGELQPIYGGAAERVVPAVLALIARMNARMNATNGPTPPKPHKEKWVA